MSSPSGKYSSGTLTTTATYGSLIATILRQTCKLGVSFPIAQATGCDSIPQGKLETSPTLRPILNSPVLGAAADLVHGIESRQDELDARGPNGRVALGVHLERLVPGRRHALHPLGVVSGGEHVADLDLDPLAEDFGN